MAERQAQGCPGTPRTRTSTNAVRDAPKSNVKTDAFVCRALLCGEASVSVHNPVFRKDGFVCWGSVGA
eukprot:44641-Rhodomonas_salina.1